MAGLVGLSLAGCGAIPKDGPYATEVRNQAQATLGPTSEQVGYALVSLSPIALDVANRSTNEVNPAFHSAIMGGAKTASVPIGIGDILSITVFEAASGGLFIPGDAGSRSGNFVAVPSQQVDSSGTIAIPYAGQLHVVGMTPRAAATMIQDKLKNRAIEPQVIVSINERHGNDVNVLGEVYSPSRFSLDPGGIRVLGAIARTGGPRYPAYETIVTIQRNGRTDQASLTTIVKNPGQNVELHAGDVVYVSREPKIFMAFGATPSPGSVGGINNRRFVFDNDNVTLAEGVAKSGGLDANRADPSAVFLFRYESRAALTAMGLNVSKYKEGLIPTIYTVDMSRPDSLFLSNSFYMRNKDVIFVSDAPVTDLNKFIGLTRGFSGIAYDAANTQ